MNARTLLYLFLFLGSSAWAAEAPVDPTQDSSTASVSEIEAVISTLEDKGSREQLVSELKTLLEARKQSTVEEEVVDARDLWQ
ncbi:MAG: hypothetical protein HUJ31_14655, partial [Pseudomonadales bacterium]|nr:hypothetical protein [Pseudomonadales bacterium]